MAIKEIELQGIPLKDLKVLYGKVLEEVDFRERSYEIPLDRISTNDLRRLYVNTLNTIRHRRVVRVVNETRSRKDLPSSVVMLVRQVETGEHNPYVTKYHLDDLLDAIEEDMELM